MNDLELSLDDIIKKKLKKGAPFRGRNNPGTVKKSIKKITESKRVQKNHNAGTLNSNSRAGLLRGKGLQSNIGDARFRIIHKQRQKLTDAREKLGQIAKQTDARLKLVKLRERQRGNLAGGRLPTFLVKPQILQRTIQSRISDSYYDDEPMDCTEDATYLNRSSTEGVISDDIYSYSYRTRQDMPLLYRTVDNQMPLNRFIEPSKNVYSWSESSLMSEDQAGIPTARTNPRNVQGIGRTDARGNGANWDLDNTQGIIITKKVKPQETVGILKRSTYGDVYVGQTVKIIRQSPPPNKSGATTRTLSERFCQKGNTSAQKISLLKAKLEASQKSNKSSETQPSVGYRIVVSNLVPSVTHEDVKELFEDIGELISSKMLRPGAAEVVYKLQKDAVKAVDVYHNRQLDGQPMKCLLVNNKSASPSSKMMKALDAKIGKSVIEVDMTAFRKALHKKSAS